VKPTRARELLGAAVLVGAVVYAVVRLLYDDLPRLPRTAPLSVLLIGLVEAQAALVTRRRLAGQHGARPIAPLTVARFAALAKASSLAGAALCGAWVAILAYTAPRTGDVGTAGADTLTAALGLGAGVVLVAGALALERVCRVPRR
jgi:adenylate kinase